MDVPVRQHHLRADSDSVPVARDESDAVPGSAGGGLHQPACRAGFRHGGFLLPVAAVAAAAASDDGKHVQQPAARGSGLVSRGSQGLRSPLESRRGSLGAP